VYGGLFLCGYGGVDVHRYEGRERGKTKAYKQQIGAKEQNRTHENKQECVYKYKKKKKEMKKAKGK
jgi:hypothetical protein